jgi:hypothetical protein
LAGHRPFGYPGWAPEVGVLQKIDSLNNSVSPAEADNWATAMLSQCEEVCPGQFHDLVSRGVPPPIVLESRAGDKPYLKSRGMEELIEAAVRSLEPALLRKFNREEAVATQRPMQQ